VPTDRCILTLHPKTSSLFALWCVQTMSGLARRADLSKFEFDMAKPMGLATRVLHYIATNRGKDGCRGTVSRDDGPGRRTPTAAPGKGGKGDPLYE
jgi:hypothetical protein